MMPAMPSNALSQLFTDILQVRKSNFIFLIRFGFDFLKSHADPSERPSGRLPPADQPWQHHWPDLQLCQPATAATTAAACLIKNEM